ncbi:prepilin peptidase [Spiribacter halobius]|uniref:Prepilin leader peptidase/N-methyltransferase n=1 Tax=Sediminicurvatus halobius TaxID=2182432 RepID=A0A2U2N7J6_9GAMM|nr:A24 family peptidase [Spiribacter halobius]PWG65161.1 prepilin peptidase [Spiribacter halobius]UEX78888.1 A24 family peptidase [Spiribacter halobius]
MGLLDILAADPLLLAVATAVLGLLVGSFLNVVILRLPVMMERDWQAQCAELTGAPPPEGEAVSLVHPGSRCPACGHAIRPWDNIPLLGWLLLRGRCRDCGARISARYPLIEAVTALLSVVVILHFGATPAGLAALVLTWLLIALTVIDLDHQLLPDSLTLPGLWLGLLLSVGGVFVAPATAIVGAAAGYLTLWLVYHGFRLLTGKEGMGHGDFKLLALLGAWLGWSQLPLVILLSSLVGALVGVGMILGLGRHRDQPIPFGPYLAAAGWIALLWGEPLIDAYLGFSGLR